MSDSLFPDMETYTQIKERHQKEFSALPIKYAFGDEQFGEMLDSWHISRTNKEEWKQISSIGMGGYMLRKDIGLLHETLDRMDSEMAEFFKEDANVKSAIIYELWNHEAIYSINPFCIVREEILDAIELPSSRHNDKDILAIYGEAWREYREKAVENM